MQYSIFAARTVIYPQHERIIFLGKLPTMIRTEPIKQINYNALERQQQFIVHCTIFLDIVYPMSYLCTAT